MPRQELVIGALRVYGAYVNIGTPSGLLIGAPLRENPDEDVYVRLFQFGYKAPSIACHLYLNSTDTTGGGGGTGPNTDLSSDWEAYEAAVTIRAGDLAVSYTHLTLPTKA